MNRLIFIRAARQTVEQVIVWLEYFAIAAAMGGGLAFGILAIFKLMVGA